MIAFPDISPEIFSIDVFGFHLALRWYAVAYIMGIVLAWQIAAAALRRPHLWPNNSAPTDAKSIEDFITYAVIGIVLGGRLGYVLFYQPSYYAQNPSEILAVWQGGMAFHGGLMGVIVASYLYFRTHHIPIGQGADMIALSVPLGLMLGRLANFINGELWGRPTDMPWGVVFPGPAAQDCGQLAGLCARHPSQLYQAGLEGLALAVILALVAFKWGGLKRTGTVTGLFFMGYGLARIIVELFRQPDPQFQTPQNPIGYAITFGEWGLTMGQILSFPMVALGILLILRARAV